MPPKLKVKPPKDDEGVPPPNDGGATNMKNGLLPTLAASARSCFSVDVSFAETNGSSNQTNPYIDSLSALEQHVCRIAESHLESSFDLSRSTGYLAWKAKNGT
jgi:hypothetical protein